MAGKLVSFGFTKTQDKKLNISKFHDDEADFAPPPEPKKINRFYNTLPSEEKKELTIPLVLRNNLRQTEKSLQISDGDDSLEAKAAREIIQETLEANDKSKPKPVDQITPISVSGQNIQPGKIDFSTFGKEATLADYENIPVKEFGLAMLRGMGWKPGDGIGRTNSAIIQPIDPVFRPKGLGLGADITAAKNKAKELLDKENETLVKGSFVQIQAGAHKGSYGKIESLEPDNARLNVQLADDGKCVSVSEYSVVWVSAAVYKEKTNVLNNDKYEKYKAKSEEHRERQDRQGRRENKRSRSKTPEKKVFKVKPKYESSDSDSDGSRSESSKKIWVRPFLRVRFIDKKFKRGKYFNTKLVVDDVAGIDSCSCKMADGRYLDGISQDWLETIVPRDKPGFVMVISGKYNGELGEILDRDKSKCVASVQLLRERLIVKLEYDSICEYVGDITTAQDY